MSKYNVRVTRADFEVADSVRLMYEELLAAEGWKALTRIVGEQIQARKELILQPDTDVSDLFLKQKLRGEIGGLGLLLRTPVAILESAKLDIELFHAQEKIDGNESDSDPDAEPSIAGGLSAYDPVPGGASGKSAPSNGKAGAPSSPDAFRRSP